MGLLDIRLWGDPVLRTPAAPVTEFDAALAKVAADMLETMREAPGVGLAAPQIGVPKRMFVFDSGDRSGAVCNPRIVWMSEETQEGEEGCLSIPEVYFPVVRALSIKTEAQDLDGNPVVFESEGFEARIFQHEIDHLDGVLFVDRLSDELRKEALKLIREMQIGERPPPPHHPAHAL